MRKPIFQYLTEAEGRTWTAEDSAYVREIFREVEVLAERVIEKRTAEIMRKPLDCVGNTGGKVSV